MSWWKSRDVEWGAKKQVQVFIFSPGKNCSASVGVKWFFIVYSLKTDRGGLRQPEGLSLGSCLIIRSPPKTPPKRLFCTDQTGCSECHPSILFSLFQPSTYFPLLHRRIQFSDPLKHESRALQILLAHTCMSAPWWQNLSFCLSFLAQTVLL